MAFAVAAGVVRDRSLAEDVMQEAYLRAFRRLRDLEEPAAFIGWLRRIIVSVGLNTRRAHRRTLLAQDRWRARSVVARKPTSRDHFPWLSAVSFLEPPPACCYSRSKRHWPSPLRGRLARGRAVTIPHGR